jgi:pyroglutamyl-peptidase
MEKTALVTGFEAYGGRDCNPSAKLSQVLHDTRIGGFRVVGRVLPVALEGLADRIAAVLDETRPALIIALGLWPGEPTIRLERFGLNLADFDIADNAGTRLQDRAIAPAGATALAASLPLRAIEEALLAEGIPARLSSTAGTYLCNATLYTLLAMLERRRWSVPCGFIHLPYLPEQVAAMLGEARAGRLAINQRADLASMDFAVMERAMRIALAAAATATALPHTE